MLVTFHLNQFNELLLHKTENIILILSIKGYLNIWMVDYLFYLIKSLWEKYGLNELFPAKV